jgi:hypothetical protein
MAGEVGTAADLRRRLGAASAVLAGTVVAANGDPMGFGLREVLSGDCQSTGGLIADDAHRHD